MSSDVALTVRGISKSYRIRHKQGRHTTLGEALVHRLSHPFERSVTEDFWALRDVSFDLWQGEVLGVIGRNGAGKSTLLKILSRITAPTEGEVHVYGRVGALLEVGTGFHPELTGRENIHLNGSILGMRRKEIESRFDEIVDFAGVDRFLDTPVKRYSSGMYVRLAFAVAATLATEVLIVDEVLAVGDAAFQSKCLQRIEQLGEAGRAVIFVSHNLSAIQRLCTSAAYLRDGELVMMGPTSTVVPAYLGAGEVSTEAEWLPERRPGDNAVRLNKVRLTDSSGFTPESEHDIRLPLLVVVEYEHLPSDGGARPWVYLHFRKDGQTIFASHDYHDDHWRQALREPGVVQSTCFIPGNFLAEGPLAISVMIGTEGVTHLCADDAVSINIIDPSVGDGARGQFSGDWPGVVRPIMRWKANVKH